MRVHVCMWTVWLGLRFCAPRAPRDQDTEFDSELG